MSKERMQKQKIDTLREILDKSWEIVISEGIEALSIRKIAAAMNFAPNNLYNYFKNKEELLLCLKKDGYQWTMDAIQEANDQEPWDPAEGICVLFIRWTKQLFHCALENPEKYIVMTSDLFMDDKEPMDQDITNLVAGRIEQGITAGEFRKVDSVATAVNIRIMLIALMRRVCFDRSISQEKADELLDNMMDILFDGIRKEK